MKALFKTVVLSIFIITATSLTGGGQTPVPPPMPEDHGQNGAPPVGAPIDGGLGILLALGATYGGKKIWDAYRKRRGA